MTNTSWYETGYSGADREIEKRELGTGPNRWWLSAGSQKQGIFVDDDPFACDEHQWRNPGSKFPLFATCLSKVAADGVCPACGGKGVDRAAYTGHLTIVDVAGWKDKDGNVRDQFELKEFCPKTTVMNKLKLKKAARGSLVGQVWTVTRATKDTASTGDDFEHVREANMEKLYTVVTFRGKNVSELITKANGHGEEAAKVRKYLAHNFQIPVDGEIPAKIPVFNYMKLHEPMNAADMRKAIANAVSMGGFGNSGNSNSGGSAGPGSADETVPF